MNKLILIFALSLALCLRQAAAVTLYQDTFSTDGALAGRAVETGTGNWIGHVNLVASNGVAWSQGNGPGKNGLLAFTPQAGIVYTLSADVTAISGSWVALGFVSDTAGTIFGNEFFYSYVDSPAPWMTVAPNGNVTTFTTASASQTFIGLGSSGTVSIVLDTTKNDWVATYYFNGTAIRTNTFSGSLDITHVGFGGYATVTPDLRVDNFQLEQFIEKPSPKISLIIVH